jgi:protein-disulfide isomerase
MIRKVLIGLGLFLLAAAPQTAVAQAVDMKEALGERSLGSKDAPVTILAFESLSCPHCASFHATGGDKPGAFAQLKKEYIDTGKVRMVFKDFPTNAPAFWATVMVRCMKPEMHLAMNEMLFEKQRVWLSARSEKEFFDGLAQMGALGGLTREDFDKCRDNKPFVEGVLALRNEATEKYKIESTPTFIIGDARIEGAQPFADFKKVIDPLLEKATK